MNTVVLFDMDGTLTPARKPIKQDMEDALARLSKVAKIGIVTGSGYEYVMQQCGSFLKSGRNFSNFTILPCNGTQKYVWDKHEWENSLWKRESSLDMRKHIGEERYQKLVLTLSERLYITHMSHLGKIPVTGNFISYRGSLINWCPIGRSANDKDRELFKKYDKENLIRDRNLRIFHDTSLSDFLSFSLGGNTSIDIYPHGWDKTYALNYYKDCDHWFVGDRCTVENGNDKPLYDKIKKNISKSSFRGKIAKRNNKNH